MKKLFAFSLISMLVTYVVPVVFAQTPSNPDLYEEPYDITQDISAAPRNWNITRVNFSPRLLTNRATGKNVLQITPTFKYTSGGDVITFQNSYLWQVTCYMSIPGSQPTILFTTTQDFPTAVNGVTMNNGNQVSSTVSIEFDKSLVRYLRRGVVPMNCSFGFVLPPAYQQNLLMNWGPGVFSSYSLTLEGNRWKAKGHNI